MTCVELMASLVAFNKIQMSMNCLYEVTPTTSLPFSLSLSPAVFSCFTFLETVSLLHIWEKYCFLFLGPYNPLGTNFRYLPSRYSLPCQPYLNTSWHTLPLLCTAPSFLFLFLNSILSGIVECLNQEAWRLWCVLRADLHPQHGGKALMWQFNRTDWTGSSLPMSLKVESTAVGQYILSHYATRASEQDLTLVGGGRFSPHAEGTATVNNLGCFWNR